MCLSPGIAFLSVFDLLSCMCLAPPNHITLHIFVACSSYKLLDFWLLPDLDSMNSEVYSGGLTYMAVKFGQTQKYLFFVGIFYISNFLILIQNRNKFSSFLIKQNFQNFESLEICFWNSQILVFKNFKIQYFNYIMSVEVMHNIIYMTITAMLRNNVNTENSKNNHEKR